MVTIWPFEAQASQLGEQALHRHLTLDMLHQDITHDPGVAAHLGRQWCYDLLACHPALAAEADGARMRSCMVKGSKPRRREPAGASMTRLGRRWGAPLPLPAGLLGPGSFVRFRRLVHAA